MSKIERNKLCPCGSDIKAKKCYYKNSRECSIYVRDRINELLPEHKEREKEVSETISQITSELNQLFYIDKDGYYVVPVRMQMLGCFSVMEVLSKYWEQYKQEEQQKPTRRFVEYCDTFCFVDKNTSFSETKYLKNINSKKLYERLRNGLSHFYGMGTKSGFVLSPNPTPKQPQKQIDLTHDKLLEKIPNLVFIQPLEMKQIIVDSGILMLQDMLDNIHASQTDELAKLDHLEGVARIYQRINDEGAKEVPLTELNEMGF